MLQRLAHLFGFRKSHEVVAKRLAQLSTRNSGSCRSDSIDFVTHIRAGLDNQAVVGASSVPRETVSQAFLDSYTRTAEKAEVRELVGAGK